MPSLWDLLCVSRQHKYSTHTNTSTSTTTNSKRHPQCSWDDPPYYDPSNVEYYIQPTHPHPSSRRSAGDRLPPGSLVQHVNMLPPRSPNSRRNFRVRDSPRANRRPSQDWYVEVRTPQPQSSSPTTGDFMLREGDGDAHPLLMKSQQGSAAVPAYPESGGLLSSGQQNPVDSNYDTAGSGKRRHVKDIFAHMSPQYHDSGLRPLDASTASVVSPGSYQSDRLGRTGQDTSGQSSGFAQSSEPRQNPRSMPISGSGQSSGYMQPAHPGHTSPFLQPSQPRQTPSRYVQPAVQSGQTFGYPPSTPPSWSPSQTAGRKPGSKSKPPESMHQYSPRTVSDSAISAALLGDRIDDFMHDPGWNRAIDRFAGCPTSTTTSAFSFEEKSSPRAANRSEASSHKTVSPTDPDGNVTFVAAAPTAPSRPVPTKQSGVINPGGSSTSISPSPQPASPGHEKNMLERSVPVGEAGPGQAVRDDVFNTDMVTTQGRDAEVGDLQAGSGQDLLMFFSADEDVLY